MSEIQSQSNNRSSFGVDLHLDLHLDLHAAGAQRLPVTT